jgi:hypothetical protein
MAQVSNLEVTLNEIMATVAALEARIVVLEEAAKPSNASQKEMTDDHALSILTGEFKDLKHNEAAKKLGLSYGQIYSCRGEYTFRHIHKKLAEKGFKNPWKKA